MGRTREQKAMAEAALQRAEDARKARDAEAHKNDDFVARLAHVETALVAAAYALTHTHGVKYVSSFEQMEKYYEAMKRAEAILDRFSIRSRKDFHDYERRTAPIWKDWKD